MPSRRILLALALGAFVSACGGSGGGSSGPTAGTLNVTLATPNSDDGALLVTLRGAPVTAVHAASGLVLYSRLSTNGDTAFVVVAGNVAAGVVATVDVPDLSKKASYSGVVNQVAQRSTWAQRSTAGYSLALN